MKQLLMKQLLMSKENNMKKVAQLFSSLVKAFILVIGICATFLQAKEQPPVGSEPNDFQVPVTDTITLVNGLKVSFIPYGTTPKTTIRLVTNTGNIDDNDLPWLSDISYEMLKQDTKNYSAKEIAEQMASMGGQLNSSVAMDMSWLGTDVLSEFSEQAIETIADIVLNASLNQEDVKRVLANHNRQLKVQLSQPGNIANQAFYQQLLWQASLWAVIPNNSFF